jgi:ADP-heptose:LPS heptosyltransferase
MKLLPEEIKKIAVLRALQLGDMLCSIPTIRALRTSYPQAEITLLGLPWAASFVRRFSMYFDRFIHFPGYPGLPEQEYEAEKVESFLETMRQEKFDLVLQMQGNGTIVNPLVQKFGAKYTAGFQNENSYTSNILFMEYPNLGHEIERHLALMKFLGIQSRGLDLEFPLTEEDYEQYKKLYVPAVAKKYVCIHPGSRGIWRQWPPQLFAAVADYCIEKDLAVIVTGTKEEYEITKELTKCARHQLVNLTGKTSLGAVALLIKNAYMLVANCTGVSHIAAAVKTPSVIISMDGEPERWAPLNKQLHKTIDWTKYPTLHAVFKEVEEIIALRKNLPAPAS